jgi:glycosyltransferase involved in cell wall biosynthesis
MSAVVQRLGFQEPEVLWLSTSRFAHALFSMRARVRACRVSEDWAHHGKVPPALIAAHDEMVDAADLVFVTSRGLKANLRARRPDAIYLPNGVSERFFASPGPEPALLSRFPHPRAVVVGRLDGWVDFDTIARVGERNPGASVLVVGPGLPAKRPYPANVHFTGPFPYDELPSLLGACDVGLVPFVRSELTHGVSPLKLFEYLASGLPVVATRLDEIEATSPPALLCDTPDGFADAVASVLDGDPEGRTARVAFAREHTWAKRFDVVKGALAARGVA